MSLFRISRLSLACSTIRVPIYRNSHRLSRFSGCIQTRAQHNRPSQRHLRQPQQPQAANSRAGSLNENLNQRQHQRNSQQNEQIWEQAIEDGSWVRFVKVKYTRPAIWALVVSGGIFVGLAYFQAKEELKPRKSTSMFEPPQWNLSKRTAPTPTEVAIGWWKDQTPISRLSAGIIATNVAIHGTSFIVPKMWDRLWHLPMRNVNYTQFTSMFVHSGILHLFVNMYFINNFMLPVGYSHVFQGSPYHTLSFFLSAGVISGFAQHLATLLPQRRSIPEIAIRSGGASGALFGILSIFCLQYPHAQLGILFLPFNFEAQYMLPAVMLFDFVGMVRGFSFVNFGHAVSFHISS
jgi:rhomboid-like protein